MSSAQNVVHADAVHEHKRSGAKTYLVDVRSPAEYADGHADGAVSIPIEQLDAAGALQVLGPDAGKEATLHLICASGLRAEQAATKLQQQGLSNVAVVGGGTEAWERQGLPMRRRTATVSLQRQTQIALGVLILALLAKGVLLHPLFYVATGLLGVGLIFAGVTARCGLTSMLAYMPWNRDLLKGPHPSR